MSEAITETTNSPEGTALPIRAIIRNPVDALPLMQADLVSATVKVHDSLDGTQTLNATPSIASVFYDTPQTETDWDYDVGFNFRYVVPGSAFPDGGRTYIITLAAVDAGGNNIRHQWKHTANEFLGD